MNPEIKKAWVVALKSGDYQQGFGILHYKENEQDKYCCLGVLCELAVGAGVIQAGRRYIGYRHGVDYRYIYDYSSTMLSSAIRDWAGLQSDTVVIANVKDHLANHNDAGKTFLEIATAIEEQL